MTKKKRRGKTEGAGDRLVGRLLEMLGKLTGNRKAKVYGKGARARGRGKPAKGAAKRRVAPGRR